MEQAMSGSTHTANRKGNRGEVYLLARPYSKQHAQQVADGMARNGERAVITAVSRYSWTVEYIPLPAVHLVQVTVNLDNGDRGIFTLDSEGVHLVLAGTRRVDNEARRHDAVLRIVEHIHTTLTWKD
jgi:hypothetical protein